MLVRAEEVPLTVHGIDLNIDNRELVNWKGSQEVRMSIDGRLIAVGSYDESRKLIHPKVVIANE